MKLHNKQLPTKGTRVIREDGEEIDIGAWVITQKRNLRNKDSNLSKDPDKVNKLKDIGIEP